jgi:hypothetical protein
MHWALGMAVAVAVVAALAIPVMVGSTSYGWQYQLWSTDRQFWRTSSIDRPWEMRVAAAGAASRA